MLMSPASPAHVGTHQRRWVNGILFLILGLAFAVRLYWMITQKGVMEGEYARLAENILAGKGYLSSLEEQPNLMYAPLYPVLIALLSHFTRDIELAGRLISVVSGAMLVLPMYFIGLHLHGKRTALICAALTAFHPLLIGFSSTVLTETTYLTFMMAGMYWGLRSLQLDSLRSCALAGFFFGLAYLIRPEAFALVLLTILLVNVLGLFQRRGLRRLLWLSGVSLAAFSILALPYIGFLRTQTGKFILEGKSRLNYTIGTRFNTGMAYNQAAWGISEELAEEGPLREAYRYAAFTPYPTGATDIARYVLTTSNRNKQILYETLVCFAGFGPILLGLDFVGFYGEDWNKNRLIGEIFLVSAFLLFIVVLLTAHLLQFRYFLSVLPLLIIWASKGIDHVSEWARSTASILTNRVLPTGSRIVVAAQCLLSFMLLLFALKSTAYVSELTEGRYEQNVAKEAGLWLKQFRPGPKTIMTSNTTVIPYYSGSVMMALPYANSSLALRYIHKKNPDFVVLEGNTIKLRPYIQEWIEKGILDATAKLVYSKGNSTENRIAIYEFHRACTGNDPAATVPLLSTSR